MWRNFALLACTVLIGFGLTYVLDFSHQAPSSASAPLMDGEARTLGGADKAVIKAGQRVPDFTFVMPDGQEHRIQDFRGRKVVLNFWASWCTPCVKEFPLFLEMAQEQGDAVVFIALSSDFDMAAMTRFLDKMRTAYQAAMDGDNVLIALDKESAVTRDLFQTFRLPETILIDSDGVMREKLVGADWDAADLEKMLRGI